MKATILVSEKELKEMDCTPRDLHHLYQSVSDAYIGKGFVEVTVLIDKGAAPAVVPVTVQVVDDDSHPDWPCHKDASGDGFHEWCHHVPAKVGVEEYYECNLCGIRVHESDERFAEMREGRS